MADLIERNKLIIAFHNELRSSKFDYLIKREETVEAKEVIHGYWYNVTNDESIDYEFACSICGYTNFEDVVNVFNYCPCCGSQMDGEEE